MTEVLQLRDMGGFRRGLTLSPSGAHIAVMVRQPRLSQNDYQHTLMVIDTHTGAARSLASAGDIIDAPRDGMLNGVARDRPALWSEDGRWLAYLRSNGDGGAALWRVRATGGAAERVADGPGDVLRFAWRGSQLIFETATPRAVLDTEARHASRHGFRVDDRFDAMYRLRPMPSLERGDVWAWRDGRIRSASASERTLLDTPQSSAPGPQRGEISAARGVDGARAWFDTVSGADGAATASLFVFRQIGASAPERCDAESCRGAIRQVWWGSGETLFFLRTEGYARSDVALYAWRGPSVSLVRRLEGVLQDCTANAQAIFCFEDTSLQPRRIMRIDPVSGAAAVLYDPNADWSRFEMPRLERIDVRDRYGNPSFAYLLYPDHYTPGRAYPAVVVQYRARGFLRAGVGGEYPVHEFARRGYFVINFERPNLDHVAGADPQARQRQTEINNIEQISKQSALEAILAELAKRGDVDMDRIGITGLSDGAETLYWALTHSNAFAVAVAGTPPTDPSVWSLSSENNRQRLLRLGLADVGAAIDGADANWDRWWDAMSAAGHVDRIDAPILLQLSDDEALTAFPFFARMRARQRPVEFFIYPDAHHVRTRPSHILAGQHRTVDWIEFWLQGVSPRDDGDPDRAERWMALRAAAPAH